ncbi:tetratricopeptide repeat protein [Aspergillus glaucus CBS 516.65]|uniref:Uncharacterized protein n=1 Tax=Aspergillus glaucus CBS 516.65 TaxID=1160497 RepID=A0A1L9V567_ASPGL|nr:hypothetical protein ASPGLDRAFT_40207 [Aspergillus glaucus CBS 516.65]OJJ79075.1 hypothetical protein ASPGLDRAFT_40207 [Aspergillus glaucus CBS 516.65]
MTSSASLMDNIVLCAETEEKSSSVQAGQKSYEEAKISRERVSAICMELEGADSVRYLMSKMALANSYQKVQNFRMAEKSFEEAFAGFEKTVGEYATKTLKACQALGLLHFAKRDMEKAKEYCEKAFQGFQKRHGTSNRLTARAAYELGTVYYQSFRFTQAKTAFQTAYEGYMQDFKEPKKFHKAITSATVDLAECCAVLGGPTNEGQAESYYQQALNDIQTYGIQIYGNFQAEDDLFRVKLKLGDLYRQRQQFKRANPLITDAYKHFSRDPQKRDHPYCVERWEATLRLGELKLDLGNLRPEEYKKDPVHLIRDAKTNLEEVAGNKSPLTLQAAILLGKICLEENCIGGCDGEKELECALGHCEKALPPGSPMTIKAMDCLVNHWVKHKNKKHEIDNMTQRKWRALNDGYGVDTTIAIMKMTDPKRENHAIWNTKLPEDNSDGGTGGSGSGRDISKKYQAASFSDDKNDLDKEQKKSKKRYIDPQQYTIGNSKTARDGQLFHQCSPWCQDCPETQQRQKLQYQEDEKRQEAQRQEAQCQEQQRQEQQRQEQQRHLEQQIPELRHLRERQQRQEQQEFQQLQRLQETLQHREYQQLQEIWQQRGYQELWKLQQCQGYQQRQELQQRQECQRCLELQYVQEALQRQELQQHQELQRRLELLKRQELEQLWTHLQHYRVDPLGQLIGDTIALPFHIIGGVANILFPHNW